MHTDAQEGFSCKHLHSFQVVRVSFSEGLCMCQHVTHYTSKGQAAADLDYQHNKVLRGLIAFSNSGRALRFCNQSSRSNFLWHPLLFLLAWLLGHLPLAFALALATMPCQIASPDSLEI